MTVKAPYHLVSRKNTHGSSVKRRPSKKTTSYSNTTGLSTTMTMSEREKFEDIEALLFVPKLNFISSAILIALCSLICYWRSLNGDFVFDDSEAIVNNRDVVGNASVSEIFGHDFWGSDIKSNSSHKSYRPLTILSFKLNYHITGGLLPWGFHVVNILVHVLVCVLFLVIFDIIFGTVQDCCDISFHLKFPRASLLCTLLFAVHPVHTESVCGIVGRAELLSALMFAAAFVFYAKSCGQDIPYVKMSFLLTTSMLMSGMAMLFKEQGITVLGFCCMYDAVTVCNFWLVRSKDDDISEKKEVNSKVVFKQAVFKPFVHRQLFLVVWGIFMVFCRFQVMGGAAPKFQPIDNPASFEKSVVFRTINYNYIYSLNMSLLIFPWWLCFDWSMGCVPVINSVHDIRILAPVIMWLMFCYISWCCLHSSLRSIYTMAVVLLVVPFLPASNLFFQVGFVIAERVLYLSVAGYCVLLVLALGCFSKYIHRKIAGVAIYMCLALLIWRSILRSAEWINEEALFTSGERVCPLNAKVHYNIGKVKADADHTEEALKYYKEAIRLNPEYDQAYNNLGNLLQALGDSSGAEKALKKAVAIRPTFAAAWMNLGIVKASLKKYEEAEVCHLNALSYRERYTDAHYNLGNMYIEWKKPDKAREEYEKSLRLNPRKENAWNNLVILLENAGHLQKAAMVCNQALELFPNHATFHFSLGNIFGKMSKFQESELHFLQAINLNPASSNYYGNLGVLYHRWGKKDKAKRFYKRSLSLDPNNQMVHENFNKLKRKT